MVGPLGACRAVVGSLWKLICCDDDAGSQSLDLSSKVKMSMTEPTRNVACGNCTASLGKNRTSKFRSGATDTW